MFMSSSLGRTKRNAVREGSLSYICKQHGVLRGNAIFSVELVLDVVYLEEWCVFVGG